MNPVPDIKSRDDLMQYRERLSHGTVWVEKLRPGGKWSAYALVPVGEEHDYIEWEEAHRHVVLRVKPR